MRLSTVRGVRGPAVRGRRWALLPVALVAALGLVVSACGTSGDTGQAAPGAAGGSATAGPSSAPPTVDPVLTTALPSKPPAGKTVVFLQVPLDTGPKYAHGAEVAAKALGWNFSTLVYDNANPGAALQQAINLKPDFIMVTSASEALMRTQLKAAHDAGIPVLSCITPGAPSPEGFTANCIQNVIDSAANVVDWMIKDSGGTANIVHVSIPAFPILQVTNTWLKENLPQRCPNCKLSEFNITAEDVASGASAQNIVGYLRANPNVKYVFFSFSSAAAPLPAAFKSAGLDDVKIGGVGANSVLLRGIIDGTQDAWAAAPYEYIGWLLTDAAARLAVTGSLTPEYQASFAKSPNWLIDTPETAQQLLTDYKGEWPGPQGFQDAFLKAWKTQA